MNNWKSGTHQNPLFRASPLNWTVGWTLGRRTIRVRWTVGLSWTVGIGWTVAVVVSMRTVVVVVVVVVGGVADGAVWAVLRGGVAGGGEAGEGGGLLLLQLCEGGRLGADGEWQVKVVPEIWKNIKLSRMTSTGTVYIRVCIV